MKSIIKKVSLVNIFRAISYATVIIIFYLQFIITFVIQEIVYVRKYNIIINDYKLQYLSHYII